MLRTITIKNFIFIKQVKLDLIPGFNVITGETGAGKSIFLNALGLTLGERIATDIIRQGESQAEVTSVFEIPRESKITRKLAKINLTLDSNELVLKRIINLKGKSKCYIANNLVTLNELKSVAKTLIDIHSQHQNLNLLKPSFYISYLDRYLGNEENLLDYRKMHFEFLKLERELATFFEQKKSLNEEKEFLKFTIKELSGRVITEEDYERLKSELLHLEKKQRNTQLLSEIEWKIRDQILPGLSEVTHLLSKVDLNDEKVNENYLNKNAKVEDYLQHLRNFLNSKNERTDYREKINELNTKLSELEGLKRKYEVNLDQLDEKLQSAQSKINQLEDLIEQEKKITEEKKKLLHQLVKKALTLHVSRKKGFPALMEAIEREISEMGMESSRVNFAFGKESLSFEATDQLEEHLNENGFDTLDLEYSASRESKWKPLKAIASGGEISRIMLALKVILTKKLPNNTIIFDEIDSGIGGETALKVGEKIKNLAADKQVLIITHLPQIAKFADAHYKVEKMHTDQTEVKIYPLKDQEIIQEISRMLGKTTSEASLRLAEEYKNE